jgi:hypothetical protein
MTRTGRSLDAGAYIDSNLRVPGIGFLFLRKSLQMPLAMLINIIDNPGFSIFTRACNCAFELTCPLRMISVSEYVAHDPLVNIGPLVHCLGQRQTS